MCTVQGFFHTTFTTATTFLGSYLLPTIPHDKEKKESVQFFDENYTFFHHFPIWWGYAHKSTVYKHILNSSKYTK
jgi:hypothetical protein